MNEVPLYQVMHAAAAADYHMCGTVTDVFIAMLCGTISVMVYTRARVFTLQ